MGRFRSGIGRLLVGTDLAVVPSYLDGGTKAWPKGKAFPRPRKLSLRIGKPKRYSHLDKSSESVIAICEDLQNAVAELGSSPK
jgi:1-acyl-sn-glycerol-3-phosphate acyltransferase/long-chain acyl-CoA synthetase